MFVVASLVLYELIGNKCLQMTKKIIPNFLLHGPNSFINQFHFKKKKEKRKEKNYFAKKS